jgi:serine/threonine-protein kinase
MITAGIGTNPELVAALTECGLLRQGDLERIAAYTRAFPNCGPEELADFLVVQGTVTKFQAGALLDGGAGSLLLSQWLLVDVLGSGSMGTVYKARSSKDDTWYAIKIVPRRNVQSLARIAERVRALKQVRHPRVSALMHIGALGERVYLVWPFLEGGEKLDALVRRQGRLPPRPAAQIVLQVASGLQAYHDQGLFHGLLKPTDVVIGADRRVRVLDFGVGFLLTSERGKSLLDTMTNTRTLARGVDCASPESILDPLARTPLGDQYSLGCILYFCLTGQFPFPGDNPVKKMLAHQEDEPPPVGELNPEVSPRLAAVVERLMSKRLEDRYESTGAVVKVLQALLASPRGLSVPPAQAGAKPPAGGRPPGGRAPDNEEERERPAEAGAPRARAWAVPLLAAVIGLTVGGLLTWLLTRS